ncbi:hypothetical protein JH06_5006 [Blastocystis sp. subtype 4]|uniref:hypothetical protein n=1 Tax=Blastocystis sp. subtype 4 TaxID=944170 RepID=UPI0007115A97|nr:hypothetical protein JH06_5006 [Blastocystis sp. subtype 4]KNB41565.1 hypothetical protein JH06_5006 [Blastocystis sp. subtype 4]|eukprot:XP_014525008.1 hypothetical protein JH06_5006 [Blastocystis sp. subtype 4]
MSTIGSLPLKRLYVDDVNIGGEELKEINTTFSRSSITVISLNNNRLGDEGFSLLMNILNDEHSLEELYLENNGITEKSIPALSAFIRRHTSLRTVDIRGSLISSDAQTDIVLVKSYSDCQIIITEAKNSNTGIEEDEEMEEEPLNPVIMEPLSELTEEERLRNEAYIILHSMKRYLTIAGIDTIEVNQPQSFMIPNETSMIMEFTQSQSILALHVRNVKDSIVSQGLNYLISPDAVRQNATVLAFTQNLPILIATLSLPSVFEKRSSDVNYTLGESLHNTTGTIKRCGQLRIEIVVLLATLLNIAIPEVITFYREYDVLSRVVSLLFEYPWNSVLHNACEVYVTEVITGHDESLKVAMVQQTGLYTLLRRRIIDAVRVKNETGRDGLGCLGVMLHLCSMLEELIGKDESIAKCAQACDNATPFSKEDLDLYEEVKMKNKPIDIPPDCEYAQWM